jgi:hypothetical protein
VHQVDILPTGKGWKSEPQNTKKKLRQRRLDFYFNEERVRPTLLGKATIAKVWILTQMGPVLSIAGQALQLGCRDLTVESGPNLFRSSL